VSAAVENWTVSALEK